MMKAIRGATTVMADTPELIREATLELLQAMMEANHITAEQFVNMTFSATADVHSAYPAKFARELPGWDRVPLFCVQEMDVVGSLRFCIRAMALVETDIAPVQHVYLRGAEVLRPDLKKS